MKKHLALLFMIALVLPVAVYASGGGKKHKLESHEIDLSAEAVERGYEAFMDNCNSCHGIKYYQNKDKEIFKGVAPLMGPEDTLEMLGKIPPDLSLMAKARGKDMDGGHYIYGFLLGFFEDANGDTKNAAFANYYGTDGQTAMPDLGIDASTAADLTSFLYMVADPYKHERESLGKYVVGFLGFFTLLFFALNKAVWAGVNKKLEEE